MECVNKLVLILLNYDEFDDNISDLKINPNQNILSSSQCFDSLIIGLLTYLNICLLVD